MENQVYKRIEEEHYDANPHSKNGFRSRDIVVRKSHEAYEKCIRDFLDTRKSEPILILDYGCGTGEKHFKFINTNVRLIGIDISGKSIEVAKKLQISEGINAEYRVMDCEKMDFPDDTFDLILDYGTFSSLNINTALPEFKRVLKSNGSTILIETLGHNPLTNFARFVNVLKGRRTKWAATHIMKINDWKTITKEFKNSDIQHYGLSVLLLSPFIQFVPLFILSTFEKIDEILLRIKFLRKYSFKTVAFLSFPVKEKKMYNK